MSHRCRGISFPTSISIESKLFILRISFSNQNTNHDIINLLSVSYFCSSSLPRYFINEKGKNISKIAKNDNNHKNIMQRFFFTGTDWKNTISIARHRDRTVKRLEAKTYQIIETYITIYVRFSTIISHQIRIRYRSSLELEISVIIRAMYVSKCRDFGGRFHPPLHSGVDFDPSILDAKLLVPRVWNNYGPRWGARPQASKNDCNILDVNRILWLSSHTFCSRPLVPESRTRCFCGLKENIRDTRWIVSKVLFIICIYDFGEKHDFSLYIHFIF